MSYDDVYDNGDDDDDDDENDNDDDVNDDDDINDNNDTDDDVDRFLQKHWCRNIDRCCPYWLDVFSVYSIHRK